MTLLAMMSFYGSLLNSAGRCCLHLATCVHSGGSSKHLRLFINFVLFIL